MRAKDWPIEGEPIKDFAQALETVRYVVGEPVILGIAAGEDESPVEVRGVLAETHFSTPDKPVFLVGEHAYLTLLPALFRGGRRSSADDGCYWGISLQQGELSIRLGEDHDVSS
jgi:hypothetical protein